MKKNYRIADKGSDRYVVGEVTLFDQKNEMFKRMLWDPKLHELGKKYYKTPVLPTNNAGHRLEDLAMVNASWYLEHNFGRSTWGGQTDLYRWDWNGQYSYPLVPSGLKIDGDDPIKITDGIKKVGSFFGATKVGVCDLDRRWLYSKGYTKAEGGKSFDFEIPEEYKYVIVLAIEMDYDAIACSPDGPASSATGLGYSRMAFEAGLLAAYIRGIGYKAIPCGNDTACSIPLAIDAGLGELGRNCMLITPEYGPRVRIAKVFTNLPLVPDKPIEFGVWEFCKTCKKCAEHCPSRALSLENPTEAPIDQSNREGLLTWKIDAKKCAAFWASNGHCCSNCIRTCPFNKKSGALHNAARWIIRHSRVFDKALVRLDDLFGYGKKKNSDKFWSKI
ncbi:MAG: reductive dehalogenase [Candidatus Aminicenantes bacterium]|nr:MAG: reductive dehalogenase [Candidatus Aminicenantes bacterium]